VSGGSGRLAGKRAVVTGAASGLGYAMATAFLREGASVLITDVDAARGEAAAGELGCGFMAQDVAGEEGWRAVMARMSTDHGGLDVLVNNAGYGPMTEGVTPEDADLALTRRIFAVNFDGTLLGCKHAIAAMKSAGGAIVNISSIAALVPVPFITAYGAAKEAVRHLTQSVALHCAQQGYAIRCNSIHPGQIRTPMHVEGMRALAALQGVEEGEIEQAMRARIPMGDYGQPEDVALAAVYLASDESRHVTGDRILVDGGMLLSN